MIVSSVIRTFLTFCYIVQYSFADGQYRALMTMEEAFDKLDEYVVRSNKNLY